VSLCTIFSNNLTIYGNLEEHMLASGVCSIKLQYNQVYKSWGSFLFNRVVWTFFFNHEYLRMFLHLIGASLADSFNLVSNGMLRSWWDALAHRSRRSIHSWNLSAWLQKNNLARDLACASRRHSITDNRLKFPPCEMCCSAGTRVNICSSVD